MSRRVLYFAEEWKSFFNDLPSEIRTFPPQRRKLTMRGQVMGLANAFVRGDSRAALGVAGMEPPFKPMRPRRSRVWEMRTGDTRSFGWFARSDIFVAVLGRQARVLKDSDTGRPNGRLYDEAVECVVAWRRAHGVEGEIADGRTWEDLVSD